MGISKKLIIFSLFSLHLLSMSNGNYCESMSCSHSGPLLRYPFHIKGRSPNSCDTPGFDVYCDDESGKSLLELPSAGKFSIEYIHEVNNEILLSDPNHCIFQKVISLGLNNISGPLQPLVPFNISQFSNLRRKYLKLYNCSGSYHPYIHNYDSEIIYCLSNYPYNVISTGINSTFFDSLSSCKFLMTMSVPPGYDINYFSRIWLTWNETLTKCPSCGDYHSSSSGSKDVSGLALGLGLGIPTAILLGIYVCCNCCKQRTNQPDNNNTTTTTTRGLQSQSRPVTCGLDQVTIDSYPVLVIGQSGRLIKPDDDTCPICLSDYAPLEMLKMLPECLHRFHADCIDQWLRAKAVCPICRISPPRS